MWICTGWVLHWVAVRKTVWKVEEKKGVTSNVLILLNEQGYDILQMVCYVRVQDSSVQKYMTLSD